MKQKFLILWLPVWIALPILADSAPEWGFISVGKPTIKASSVLKEGKKTYPAKNAIDGKVTTAWCEGAKGSGIGETLEVSFSATPGSGLGLFPGFGRSKRLYYSNNRIKDYELVLFLKSGKTKKIRGKFEDNLCGHPDHRECNYVENDIQKYEACEKRVKSLCYYNDYNRGGQVIFDKPLCVTKIRFKILSVYKGKKHNDTCIAELGLLRPIDAREEYRKAFQELENNCR